MPCWLSLCVDLAVRPFLSGPSLPALPVRVGMDLLTSPMVLRQDEQAFAPKTHSS